jgi:hypothetical protein
MATVSLAPVLRQYYQDANGNPLAGGKVYTYQSGTTTLQPTYVDSAGVTANANPVILDANGSANIWFDVSLSYKTVVKDSNDVTIFTTDGVIGLSTNNSVATASLQDGAVTTPKLADASVTNAKLASDAVTDANRPVNTNNIRDGAITTSKLDVGAIGSSPLNIGLTATVASNALTIALKGADGNDPSATNTVKVKFRNSGSTTGTPVSRTVSAALSIVVPNGATLGTASATAEYIYVYLIDNAGTAELAVTLNPFVDEGTLINTSAVSGGSTKGVVYSTTARTSVAARLIGRLLATETTAGTWASSPSEISIAPFYSYKASWSGYHTVASGWSTTTSTFVDPTTGTTIALTQTTNMNFGGVATAGSSLPGLLVNFPRTGRFWISASVQYTNAASANNISFRLVDGSSTLIDPGRNAFIASSTRGNTVLSGIYNVTSVASAITIKLQLASDAGVTATIGTTGLSQSTPAIQWNIVSLD